MFGFVTDPAKKIMIVLCSKRSACNERTAHLCIPPIHTFALQALATACVCTGTDQPANTKQVTARLMDQLVSLVDPECDLEHVGAANPVSITLLLECTNTPCSHDNLGIAKSN